ncbi:hypothetical protein BC835DRAFT_1416711 [Cytidiella melzeri]|nr:hypothetical protein BC835DRAFT_1416711 [Cytidiella melzeri]
MSTSPTVIPHQPLPIAEPRPAHHRRQTSPIQGSRRAPETNKVPRPRNAFIIFRCQNGSQLHSKDNVGLARPPTPEKTLSKRAGAAWRNLPESEKQVFKDLAERERLEHQEKYPDYRYQPNRSKSTKARTAGPPTRREQVESLLLRGSSSHSTNSSESSDSLCPSPASERCTSPESGMMPALTDDSGHSVSHRRSASLPHLQMMSPQDPYPYSRTYFIEPTSCDSSPGPGPHRNSRRSKSARDRSYSPACLTPPPDCAFDLQYEHTTIPFSSLAPHSSTLSLPELVTLSECLALDEAAGSDFSTPQTSPSTSAHEHSTDYFLSHQAPPPTALFHRRQRSNTAPSVVMSPMTAVSTSIGNWNGAVTATAAATAGLPNFIITPSDDNYSMGSPVAGPMTSPLTDGTVPYAQGFFGHQSRESYGNTSSLSIPEAEMDLDRTPRSTNFPVGIQEQYTQTLSISTLDFHSAQSNYDLQSYTAALDDLNISATSPYDMAQGPNSMSLLEDINWSEFLSNC